MDRRIFDEVAALAADQCGSAHAEILLFAGNGTQTVLGSTEDRTSKHLPIDENADLVIETVRRTRSSHLQDGTDAIGAAIGVPMVTPTGAVVGLLLVRDLPTRDVRPPAVATLTRLSAHAVSILEYRDSLLDPDRQRAILLAGNAVFELIMGGADLSVVLNSLARAVDRSIVGTRCSILLLDGLFLRHGAGPRLPQVVRDAFDGVRIGQQVGSCGTAAYIGETVIVEDIATDIRWANYRHVVLPHGLRSCWSVPIQDQQGQVLGTFALYYDECRAPKDDELKQMARWGQLAEIAISRARDLTALREAAAIDALTGLVNRTEVLARLTTLLNVPGSELAVLFIDIDQFKFVNDTFGHQTGDTFLKVVGHRLSASAGQSDTVARIGGDEFLIVCPRIADPDAAQSMARRVLEDLQRPITLKGRSVALSVSIGIALHPGENHVRAVDLISDADLAMYEAKRSGHKSVSVFSPSLRSSTVDRLELEAELSLALHREELHCFYQPVLDLTTGAVLGIEALLRWISPSRGAVPPSTFIPVAEDSGLIVSMGEFALATACRQMASWRTGDALWNEMTLWVNVSARQLDAADFAAMVDSVLAHSGLPPEALGLEVTESCFISNAPIAREALMKLRRKGIRIAIDDFGTGYSSLSQLQFLPVDILKIDQEFIGSMVDRGPVDTSSTVRAIIMLAHALDMGVVAEGVETSFQRDQLISLGCTAAQGFYWAPALAPPELEAYVDSRMSALKGS